VGEPRFDGLVSHDCHDLAFDTAGALNTAADTAIPGMAVRGRKLAEELMKSLPEREAPPQPAMAKKVGADWVHGYTDKQFEGFVDHRGLAPNVAEADQAKLKTASPKKKAALERELTFPDPEGFMRDLATRDPATLSPAEHLTLTAVCS